MCHILIAKVITYLYQRYNYKKAHKSGDTYVECLTGLICMANLIPVEEFVTSETIA